MGISTFPLIKILVVPVVLVECNESLLVIMLTMTVIGIVMHAEDHPIIAASGTESRLTVLGRRIGGLEVITKKVLVPRERCMRRPPINREPVALFISLVLPEIIPRVPPVVSIL